MATYSKLRSGEWGIRVQGSVVAGAQVAVTTKAGASKTETVARVLWSGDGISLCSIVPSSSPSSSRRPYSESRDMRRARAEYARTGDYYGSGLYDEES